MEEKKSKKPIIIGVAVTLLVTLTLLGVTYAYYRTRIIGNQNDTSISVTSKELELTYDDGNGIITASGISPGESIEKSFTVENTGNDDADYSLKFEILENTFQRNMDWTYTLKQNGNVLISGMIRAGGEQVILFSEPLIANAIDDYDLILDYANSTDDQSIDMGASLKIKVDIDNVVNYWNNAEDGTLLAAIKSDNTVKSPVTTPGKQVSSSTEAVLASTEDDYGTSYYFRGNVTNNFVNFSGMCWRIVRVQGDGTIKLALADRDNECDSANYSLDNTDSAYITGGEAYVYWDKEEDDPTYENSDVYEALNAWLNDGTYTYFTSSTTYSSNLETKTETFTNNIDQSKLAVAEWCNDLSIKSIYYNSQYSQYSLNLNSFDRIESTYSPSLKCDFTGANNTFARKNASKIGTLTADEAVFAGTVYHQSSTGYLTKNAGDFGFWTLTPESLLQDGLSFAYSCMSMYRVNDSIWDESLPASIRPAVVLRSDVTIEDGGTGTQTNPYVIS